MKTTSKTAKTAKSTPKNSHKQTVTKEAPVKKAKKQKSVKIEHTPESFNKTPMRTEAVERVKEMGLLTKVRSDKKVKQALTTAQDVRRAVRQEKATKGQLHKALAVVAKLLKLEEVSDALGRDLARAAGCFDKQ